MRSKIDKRLGFVFAIGIVITAASRSRSASRIDCSTLVIIYTCTIGTLRMKFEFQITHEQGASGQCHQGGGPSRVNGPRAVLGSQHVRTLGPVELIWTAPCSESFRGCELGTARASVFGLFSPFGLCFSG